MIPLSVAPIADTSVGAPVAGKGNSPQGPDFVTVLAGASAAPVSDVTTPAGELPAALPAGSGPAAQVGVPGAGGAALLSSSAVDAGEGARPTLGSAEHPSSTNLPADASVDATTTVTAPEQLANLSVRFSDPPRTAGASPTGTDVAPAIAPATPSGKRLATPPVSGAPAAAASLNSEETKKIHEVGSDTPTLPIQQVLAAAASLAAPVQAAPLQQANREQAFPPAALAIETRTATVLPATTKRAGNVSQVQDDKLSAYTADGLQTIQLLSSQDPALIAGQHRLPVGHMDRAIAASIAATAPAHALAAAAQSQVTDLHQLDALVREISEVAGNTGRAALRLTADQLGPLEIKLHRSDAGMNVTIRTESEQSHAAVAQAQQQLSDDLRANGLKVAATSVMLGHGGADRDQRDRQQFNFSAPIEARMASEEQSDPDSDERPTGRFA